MGEIENAIMSIEKVENACCVFNPGNGDIIAIYTGKIESSNIANLIAEKLPHYMFPSKYVHLEVMPMNLNGKIDRMLLKKEYIET